MPFYRHFSRRQSFALAAFGFLAVASPALAGGAPGERSYADSFGNLVIHSPSGFKRILVGKGYLANAATGAKAVHIEEDRGQLYLRRRETCRYGARLTGRSYMYGLPDNVVPVPTVSCR